MIGLVADVASRYSRVLLFSQEKDKASQAITTVQALVSEVEQCAEVLAPSGSGETVLKVIKVRTEDPMRTEDLEDWKPYRSRELETVEYALQGDDIVRTLVAGSSTVLLNDVTGFSTSLESRRSVRIEISVKDGEEVKTFTGSAFVWSDPMKVQEP